MSLLTDEFTKR